MICHCLHLVFKSLIATKCTRSLQSSALENLLSVVKEVLCDSGTRAKWCIIDRLGINWTQISQASGRWNNPKAINLSPPLCRCVHPLHDISPNQNSLQQNFPINPFQTTISWSQRFSQPVFHLMQKKIPCSEVTAMCSGSCHSLSAHLQTMHKSTSVIALGLALSWEFSIIKDSCQWPHLIHKLKPQFLC